VRLKPTVTKLNPVRPTSRGSYSNRLNSSGSGKLTTIEINSSLRSTARDPGAGTPEGTTWRSGCLASGNGPEFISQALSDWCDDNSGRIQHIQPGKPNRSVYIERFNRTYRNQSLNLYLFRSLREVREITAAGSMSITSCGHTMRWAACRLVSTLPKLPATLLYNCLLDGQDYTCLYQDSINYSR